MSNTYRYTVEFDVPDKVKEENVLLVLREFFGDLMETHRFNEATVFENSADEAKYKHGLEDHEVESIKEVLSQLSDEEMFELATIMEESENL